jgi:hypothetical protein
MSVRIFHRAVVASQRTGTIPAGFLEIPDWFGWENQGCEIASTEVDGDITLVASLVDAGVAGNRGAYCIGSGVAPVSGAAAT